MPPQCPSCPVSPADHQALLAGERQRITVLIDTELARLARRHPTLRPQQLAVVRETMWRIAQRLHLDALERGRRAPEPAIKLLAADGPPRCPAPDRQQCAL